MSDNKLNELLEKYEKLRNKPVLLDTNNLTPTKRTLEQTKDETDKEQTLKQLKNKDLHQTTAKTTITNKSILSKYESDEKVNGIDRKMESLGSAVFKNMKQFDSAQYQKSSEWYVEKELERLK